MGGTFDPPHYGHLHLAQAAQEQLGLRRVLWIIAADPPHKQDREITPVADRLELVAAAIEALPGHAISRVDIDRPGPHWAADTVALLAAKHPDDQLYFLMGGDSLRDLPTWGRPREFLTHTRLGVLRRPGAAIDLGALEAALPGLSQRVEFIDAPRLDISAHSVRQRAAAGESLAGFVPPAVAELIEQRGLYR
jgi:nicotinate-nucleotide adenylyltransferase